jgi:hypothetical protein
VTSSSWRLDHFGERLDRWKEQEDAPAELVRIVIEWSLTRLDDPYSGVRREAGFGNLWFGPIPGTVRADTVVTCSYWIFARDHVVSCNGYATLSLPL